MDASLQLSVLRRLLWTMKLIPVTNQRVKTCISELEKALDSLEAGVLSDDHEEMFPLEVEEDSEDSEGSSDMDLRASSVLMPSSSASQ